MALPDSVQIRQGTAIVFGQPSASGVTHDLTLDALANGTARQSTYADLGEDWDDEYIVEFLVETGTAPTAGNTAEVYLLSSTVTTRFPAKATGSDAAYTLGTSDANLRQAGSPVVSLVATNDATTTLSQAPAIWRPRGRYVVAIVDNNLGQAFRDETTGTDNDSRVILTPRRVRIND